jgi:hypothetical protein
VGAPKILWAFDSSEKKNSGPEAARVRTTGKAVDPIPVVPDKAPPASVTYLDPPVCMQKVQFKLKLQPIEF